MSDIKVGVGVLIVKNKKYLVGTRLDNKGICGPGGHMQDNETALQAAIRETKEEFNIEPLNIRFIGLLNDHDGTKPSYIFVAHDFSGQIKTDENEMTKPMWLSYEDLLSKDLFKSFAKSLELYRSC